MDDQRLAEIKARAENLIAWTKRGSSAKALAAEDVPALLAEIERLRPQLRDATNDLLAIRGILSPSGEARKVPFEPGAEVAPAVEWLVDEVERLNARIAAAMTVVEGHDIPEWFILRDALTGQPEEPLEELPDPVHMPRDPEGSQDAANYAGGPW